MKHLKKYNESKDTINNIYKSITEEEKKDLDLIFIDFIDIGAISKLEEYELTTYVKGEPVKETLNEYLIRIDFISMIKNTNPNRVSRLLKKTEELAELIKDLQVCVNRANDSFKLSDSIICDKNTKHKLDIGNWEEVNVNDQYSIILKLKMMK